MFQESVTSVPSIWASMNSWLTPAVFFLILNVMIGTILFTSNQANQKQQQQTREDPHQQQQPRLARSPSVLQRLKSFDFSINRSKEPNPSPSMANHFNFTPYSDAHYPPQQTHQQQTVETETQFVSQQSHQQQTLVTETQCVTEQTHDEIEDDGRRTMDEISDPLTGDHHVSRTMSDTMPASGEVPRKLPTKMRKSASVKSAFGHFEAEDIVETRRPATVREGKASVTEEDNEVDAKADDFINKFRQQLKLQRLNSFTRYKEMIGRGSGK